MFFYKNQFLLIFSFLSIPIELWESTEAIILQSAGYVYNSSRIGCSDFRHSDTESRAKKRVVFAINFKNGVRTKIRFDSDFE